MIGYQNAAHIAESALANGQTLKEAALDSGHVDEDTFNSVVDPLAMIGDGVAGAGSTRGRHLGEGHPYESMAAEHTDHAPRALRAW